MECTTTNVELEYFYMKVIDMVFYRRGRDRRIFWRCARSKGCNGLIMHSCIYIMFCSIQEMCSLIDYSYRHSAGIHAYRIY